MSRLYISDLEKILKGDVVRFSLKKTGKNNSLVALSTINNEISETRNFRNTIINMFKDDINNELLNNNLDNNIVIYGEQLFFNNYFKFLLEDSTRLSENLVSENGLVTASDTSDDLYKKVELMLPYVKKLLTLKKNTHVLDNLFYEDIDVFKDQEKVLNISGAGVDMPFELYNKLNDYDLKQLLTYFYSNYNDILKNILIDNDKILDRFLPEREPDKILKLYKDTK